MKKGKVLSLIMIVLAFIAMSFIYINSQEDKTKSEDFSNQTSSDTNNHGAPEILNFDSAEEIRNAIEDFNNPSSRGEFKASLLERVEKLRSLLEVADADFNKERLLGIEMQEFMKDKNFSRSEKVYALWDLIDEYIKKYDVNIVRVDYLLDTLLALQPIELTDNLINIINSQGYPASVNSKILKVLVESHGMVYADTSKLSQETIDFIYQNGDKIKNLFNQIMSNPYDKEIFKQAILLYPRVASSDDYHIVDAALQQHTDLLSIQDATTLRIDSTMMDQNMISNHLAPLLDSLNSNKYSIEDKSFALNRLSVFIGPSHERMQLSDANRIALIDFFQKNEPSMDSQYFQEDSFGAMSDYGSWFDTYSTLNSTNAENKQAFINDFINTATTLQKVAIINKISIDKMDSPIHYQGLQKNEGLKSGLNDELSNPTLSEAEKTAIRDALQALSQ